MKIWMTADTHFGMRGDDEEYLNDYVGYFEDALIPMMEHEVGKDDIFVHCGDVFDNRSSVGLNTLTRVIGLFEKLSGVFGEIKIVIGNHDIYKKSSNDITSVNMLKHIPNVRLYYKPEVETLCGKKCLFNPWIESLEKEKELLDSVDVDYIFGHLMIGGSQTSNRAGIKVDIESGIKVSDFKRAQVYAGHIHIRQNNRNVHYLGNPYQKDRGDLGNSKGISVLDIETGKVRFIENKVSPKFVKENIYDILDYTVEELKRRWHNNRVDLHVNGNDITRCNFDGLRECLRDEYRCLDTVADNEVSELNTDVEHTFTEAKSSDDYLAEFLNRQDLEDSFRKKVESIVNGFSERL